MPQFENGRDLQFHHSTLIDVGRDSHIYHGSKQTALSILKDHVAASAFHNSSERFDPPKCHPRTRTAVLNHIREWYKNEDPTASRIMWLYGPAGAGKSAIAQTMAEECHKLGTLTASFFFSRAAPGRNDASRLVATIAYQIAQDTLDIRPHMDQALENDPIIFSKSMESQLHQLVTKPLLNAIQKNHLSSKPCPKLIIIDGLDECSSGAAQQDIVHCFASLVQEALQLRVLILSRPEQPIRDSFSRRDLRWTYVSLVLDDNYQSDRDVELFLRESLNEIRQTHVLKPHIPKTWPSDDNINALVRKSSGQFIFASTVIRYVKSPRHRPMDRLQIILGIGRLGDSTPFVELDAFYMHILQSADEAQHNTVMRIFGFLLCRMPHYKNIRAPAEIEDFLGLLPGDVYLALADFHSIINLPPAPGEMHFLHASISDFLIDPVRSQRYFVDQGKVHAELAQACMRGVSSSQNAVLMYSLDHLTGHCESAHMDKALLEDLLHFNVSDFFQTRVKDRTYSRARRSYMPWLLYKPCFKQMSWIRQQFRRKSFNLPKALLDCHLATVDYHLREKILTLPFPDRAPEIIALAEKIYSASPNLNQRLIHYANRIPVIWQHACLLLNLNIVDTYQNVPDAQDFIICTPFKHPDMEIEELFLEFLHDQKRAGKYYISPEVYARVALQCIESICTEANKLVPLSWGWSMYKDHENDGFKACHKPRTCNIGLKALPSILSSAAPSVDLATSLRAGKSSHWAEISVARAEYLKRYNNWEKQQFQSDQEVEENPRAAKRPRRLVESSKESCFAETLV